MRCRHVPSRDRGRNQGPTLMTGPRFAAQFPADLGHLASDPGYWMPGEPIALLRATWTDAFTDERPDGTTPLLFLVDAATGTSGGRSFQGLLHQAPVPDPTWPAQLSGGPSRSRWSKSTLRPALTRKGSRHHGLVGRFQGCAFSSGGKARCRA